jgi:hypothetical protein
MNKTELLSAITATHAELAAAAAALDDDALAGPAPAMDGWTRKDVLAHLTWWSDHSVRVVEALRAGREPYVRDASWDADTENARILAEYRDISPRDARRSEAESFARLVAAVEAASEVELFEVGRYPWLGAWALADIVIGDSTDHFPDHLPQLR